MSSMGFSLLRLNINYFLFFLSCYFLLVQKVTKDTPKGTLWEDFAPRARLQQSLTPLESPFLREPLRLVQVPVPGASGKVWSVPLSGSSHFAFASRPQRRASTDGAPGAPRPFEAAGAAGKQKALLRGVQ